MGVRRIVVCATLWGDDKEGMLALSWLIGRFWKG